MLLSPITIVRGNIDAKKVETRRKRTEEAEAQAKKEAEKLPPEEGEKSKS